MGVGGQTFDTDGNPVKFIVVEVGGELVGNEVSMLSLTGSVPAYGPAGYEFTLASAPIGTSGTLWLQLYDLEGNPLSERVFIDTHSSCDRNLVIVNFIKLPAQLSRSYLPSVMNALFPTETPTLEPTP